MGITYKLLNKEERKITSSAEYIDWTILYCQKGWPSTLRQTPTIPVLQRQPVCFFFAKSIKIFKTYFKETQNYQGIFLCQFPPVFEVVSTLYSQIISLEENVTE
ncbi:hypothetical protein CHS0354_035897 [Potamilus streckersoni]|uniref:Uncharacterized protein n=1 Tax=Potamilus streckersoni TaxID=2493646 RepID=A0AAE0T5D6_9BIVA|nr:hypothetical protein CHS0354_035897 [Potamilus streckersoni]